MAKKDSMVETLEKLATLVENFRDEHKSLLNEYHEKYLKEDKEPEKEPAKSKKSSKEKKGNPYTIPGQSEATTEDHLDKMNTEELGEIATRLKLGKLKKLAKLPKKDLRKMILKEDGHKVEKALVTVLEERLPS